MTWTALRLAVAALLIGAAPVPAAAQDRDQNGVVRQHPNEVSRPRDRFGVPSIMVPEKGTRSAVRRRSGRTHQTRRSVEPPPLDRRLSAPVTVPSPQNYGASIPVPDTPRVGETFQDRVVRCSHYGSLYGVPGGQQGGYIANCAN